MPVWLFILIILVVIMALGGLLAMLYITVPIAKKVYMEQLVRTSQDKWGRVCSAPDNEEQMQMWNEGVLWSEENKGVMKEVSVKNGELSLYGEFYDFGSDKCVIILPGRCESLMYSYYFAKPYQKAGQSVLLIDSRCHGKSDGTYSTIGVYEAEDVKVWMSFIADKFGIKSFWLHGVCIGSGAALFAANDERYEKMIEGIVLEGCFVNFRETFKQHMIADKRPLFPVLDLVMHYIKKYAKVNVLKKSPINAVCNIHCPILFLFGKKDIFSIPPKSQKLFDRCASEKKKLVWFEKGGHSHLRINNQEKYDNEIIKFVGEYGK